MRHRMIGLYALLLSGLCGGTAFAQPGASTDTTESEARAIFAKLLAFPTTSGAPAINEMAGYLAGLFKDAGFRDQDIELVPVGKISGLIVRYPGKAGSGKKPVVFMAHMDVVDAPAPEWATDPWKLVERDGALRGRGVVDNKYGLLTIAHAFIRLKREGFVPSRDLVIAFSGDEETGMKTTALLAERLKGAAFAVNADAGGGYRSASGVSYYFQAAEKTYATFELTIRNRGGHSSAPRADNAIYELADVLGRLARYRFPVRWNEVSIAAFEAMLPTMTGGNADALRAFLAKPGDAAAVAVLEQDPAIDKDLRTTCVATKLAAGTVENALATAATATVNCRIFPGESIEQIRIALAGLSGAHALEVKVSGSPVESPVAPMPAEALAALRAVLAQRAPDARVAPYMEAGGTDGLHFRRAGIPTIGIGPLFSDDATDYRYHAPDENLPVTQFRDGLDHYYRFVKALQ